MPEVLDGYAEPFLDGGATAIAVLTARPEVVATLFGQNPAVVEVWQVVRDDVDALIRTLRWLEDRHSPAFFAGVRERDLDPASASSLSPAERAARYVYLRGTARPDARGDQPRVVTRVAADPGAAPVEYGRDAVPIDETGLRMLARLLGDRDVTLAARPPFELLGELREDELLWLDPTDAAGDVSPRELRSLVGSAVARGAAVLAPGHPLLDGARELAVLARPADDVTLLGSAALRRALRP
ncbi:DNA adenine methylase [Herbiconiux flava]|uniref:site-specific DNA-methyltransferase (adenine-specific) n=1 Tax=Herbiconiux flava TaxID=881268 RepID=A0A852SRB2_9MICO|nr:DNA adenine methylase [Herbiconiux flava]NYD71323.1 hypothetical protein [Herbiconiux flava]GLK18713.1 hypothetical protein GCM10017602_31950 [Herbiconiux flava]